MMNFSNLIIDAEKMNKACFLCFEYGQNKLYEEIVIQGSNFNLKTSLYNITKYLLPGYDILFGQACNYCMNVIIKMFSILQDHLIKKDIFEKIVNCINKEIPSCSIQKNCIIQLLSDKTLSTSTINENNLNDSETFIKTKDIIADEISHKRKSMLNNSPKSTICDICGKHCMNPKALKAHLNCHIEKHCPYCNKLLKTHSHFNKHVRNHKIHRNEKNKKKYYCSNCKYFCWNKSDLEAHSNKMHLKIKPYKCKDCLKCFYKKSNLLAHMLIHSNIKQFVCEICGQDFTCKKTLSDHLKLHSGEKIFKCDVCKRNFTTKSRKNEHIKRNHSNEVIACSMCNKKYTLKKELNNHMKRFHNNLE